MKGWIPPRVSKRLVSSMAKASPGATPLHSDAFSCKDCIERCCGGREDEIRIYLFFAIFKSLGYLYRKCAVAWIRRGAEHIWVEYYKLG